MLLSSNLIVSEANAAVLVPRNGMTANMFPGAPSLKTEKHDHLVLPHGVREFMLLRRIGYKCPNPILRYYDWRGGKPFSVQKSTCALLTSSPRAYVLNAMGTGKTKAALWSWDWLKSQGVANRALVVAPLSTLEFVWGREVMLTLPHRKVAILHGTREKRIERLNDLSNDIYVINHDGLKTIADLLHKRGDIDVLIIDELAVYRNDSKRSKLMRKFAERFTWAWGMTGAPMPNEPTDVWAQAKILTPHTVPKYRSHARDMLMTKGNSQYIWFPKPDAVQTAYKMLQPAVRYTLDDVTELPETVYRTVDIPLSSEQSSTYKKMAKEFQIAVQNRIITAVNAAAAMTKLLQVSSGWVYSKAPEYVTLDNDPRVKALIDLLESSERKVLVFVPFTNAVLELSKILSRKDVGIDHAVIHGPTPATERNQIFNLFQNSTKFHALLVHPGTIAHGVTLTEADTAVWWSPIASLETYEQANARIIRVGQKHRQQIIHFQSTGVEKRIYSLLRGKQKVQDMLLNLFENATETLND